VRARVEETSARSNCAIGMRYQSAIGVRGRWCENEDEGEDEEEDVEVCWRSKLRYTWWCCGFWLISARGGVWRGGIKRSWKITGPRYGGNVAEQYKVFPSMRTWSTGIH
jgi:hypothetical protein